MAKKANQCPVVYNGVFDLWGCYVDAIDASAKMCKLASEYTGIRVKNMFFQELTDVGKYNGIWACSSILHLAVDELTDVMRKILAALREKGVIYTSFKYGIFIGERNGRFFTDMTENSFAEFIPAKQRAKRELARIWRLPRGSNTPPLWGELAKKKLSHAPLLAAGYLTKELSSFVNTSMNFDFPHFLKTII